MIPGLILVDLQLDFLQHEALSATSPGLVARAEKLLSACRARNIPVFHVWTRVRRDGSDRMPHWKRDNTWLCVEDTPGQFPPTALKPANDEPVFTKQYYNAFSNPNLEQAIRNRGVNTLIVAGVHLHGCVRATVFDAYERGFEILIADDAVGSYQPVHAEISRMYMAGRVAEFRDIDTIAALLNQHEPHSPPAVKPVPVANINGVWKSAGDQPLHVRYSPSSHDNVIATIPLADLSDIQEACSSAGEQARKWKTLPNTNRISVLKSWAEILSSREDKLASLLADEIGKPVNDGHAEIQRAVALLQASAELSGEQQVHYIDKDGTVHARLCPRGVIGLITPWNNPIAIPVGKLAPALAYGNTVVWKPAIEAPGTAMAVMESFHAAGGMPGTINLVCGQAGAARAIIGHTAISAVSLTGSLETGRTVSALCCHYGKELQAELGGNNAAIVLKDCDLKAHAYNMALSAFSFSGQRCTAIRRFIVEKSIYQEFRTEFISAVQKLKIGDPHDMNTNIGPLVSDAHWHSVSSAIEQARREGAEVYCGGKTPDNLQQGYWMTPTVIGNISIESGIVQNETFGPVAVIMPAEDLEQAIQIANSVRHGLVAALYSDNKAHQRRFAEAIEAGILNFAPGPVDIHPLAPFGGWKASGLGPPEHGLWDRQFYCKPQAVYGIQE